MDRVKALVECARCEYKFEDDITDTDSDAPTPCPNCGLAGMTISHPLVESDIELLEEK